MTAYLSDTLCSNCQSAGLEVQTESTAVCRYCGTVNTLNGVICPHCEFVNAEGVQACDACHQTLVRRCPNCDTPNWAGAERCLRCQKPLDAMASLSARYRTDTAGRLRAQQHDAAGIKAKEAVDSQRRMAGLNAIEERRQQYLNQAIQARDSQQRLWIGILIGLGFIVIVAAVIGLAFFLNQ
jgi:hypothetical protein